VIHIDRSLGVPLFWYLAIAVGVPLLDGAAAHPAFSGHVAVVGAVVGALVLLRRAGAGAGGYLRSRLGHGRLSR
jgi:hypothetical protein